MKILFLTLFVLTGFGFTQTADPISKSFTVKCTYEGDDDFRKIGFKPKPTKGEYHYQAYLPKAYGERDQDKFPILFLMSPGGSLNIGSFASILDQLELIGIGLQEAKNGPCSRMKPTRIHPPIPDLTFYSQAWEGGVGCLSKDKKVSSRQSTPRSMNSKIPS